MLRYKRTVIEGTLAERTLATVLSGTEGEPKHVRALHFAEVSAALQYDAILEIWIEQQQIAEFSITHFLDGAAATPLKIGRGVLPLDLDLPAGLELTAGFTSGAAASDYEFVVEYESG